MKTKTLVKRIAFAVLIAIFLALFVICCGESQSGHDWHEMYQDQFIRVERCSICGLERITEI